MAAPVHLSLIDVPEIFLTLVSTLGVGFLLWFLAGLLREEQRMRARPVHNFGFSGARVLKFGPRDHKGAHAAPTVRAIKVPGDAGTVQVFSAPELRSSKDAVKMRWMLMCLLVSATAGGFQTPSRPLLLLLRRKRRPRQFRPSARAGQSS